MSDETNPLLPETKTAGVTVGETLVPPLEPKKPADAAELAGKPGDTVGRHFISIGKLWKNRAGNKLVPDGHEEAATLFASKGGLKFDESQLAGIDNVGDAMTTIDHVVSGEGAGDQVEAPAFNARVVVKHVDWDSVGFEGDKEAGETAECGGGFKATGELSGKFAIGDKFALRLVRVLALLLFIGLGALAFAGADPLPAYTGGVYQVAGTPGNGTSCIQTITFGGTPTGGTFTLTFKGRTTSAITWSATNATLVANIDAALEALQTLSGGSSVTTAVGTMTAGIGTITVTFTGNYQKLLLPVMSSSSSLTGSSPTLGVAITTAGVTADGRSSVKGALCVDTTNGILYQNQGTSGLAPSWVKVSGE